MLEVITVAVSEIKSTQTEYLRQAYLICRRFRLLNFFFGHSDRLLSDLHSLCARVFRWRRRHYLDARDFARAEKVWV